MISTIQPFVRFPNANIVADAGAATYHIVYTLYTQYYLDLCITCTSIKQLPQNTYINAFNPINVIFIASEYESYCKKQFVRTGKLCSKCVYSMCVIRSHTRMGPYIVELTS